MDTAFLPSSTSRRLPIFMAGALLVVTAVLVLRFKNPAFVFSPLLVLGGLYLGSRLFAKPVWVLAIFLFSMVNLDFVKVGAGTLTLDILITLAFMWALMLRFGLDKRVLMSSRVEKAYIIFLAVAALAAVGSVDLGLSLRAWIRYLEYILFFAFVLSLDLTMADRRQLVGAILLSSIVPCVLGLLGMWLDIPSLYGLETPLGGGESVKRISSTLRHPVSFSLYLALVSILNLSFLLDGRWFRRSWTGSLFFLQLGLLYLTFGRTGWIVFAVAVAVLLWTRGMKRVLFLGAPIFLGSVILFLPTFLDRWQTAFQTGGNNSFLWRIGLWLYTINLVPKRPVLGSGPGTFTEYVAYETGKGSHQTWLGILVEMGVVGLISFLFVIVMLGRALHQSRRTANREAYPLVVGVFALYVGFLAGSIAEHPFALPVIGVYLWTLFAMAIQSTTTQKHPVVEVG